MVLELRIAPTSWTVTRVVSEYGFQLKAALAAELQGGLVFAQTSAEHPLLLRSLQALYKRADQADILEESYM